MNNIGDSILIQSFGLAQFLESKGIVLNHILIDSPKGNYGYCKNNDTIKQLIAEYENVIKWEDWSL